MSRECSDDETAAEFADGSLLSTTTKSHFNELSMKKIFVGLSVTFLVGFISLEIENIFNPSDSGDMRWVNYEITEYKANRGDVKSKIQLLIYYQYNDNNLRGGEIADLLKDIVDRGYGGVKNGGDGVVVDLINECEKRRLFKPSDVADAFKMIKTAGGGLTSLGYDIEKRWRNGDFPNCPAPESSK